MPRPSNNLRKEPARRALDRTDRVLLDALQKDARLSNKELAGLADLAPSSCLERVRRLERDGAIQGYHAELDAGQLGLGLQAMIGVQLRFHVRESFDSFGDHLRNLPEARGVWQLAGSTDFLVHVVCRDTAHLHALTVDAFTRRPEVSRIETSLVFSFARTFLPIHPDAA